MKISHRLLDLKLGRHQSAFLWGPRRVGKSYWIRHSLKNITLIDLLKTDVFAEYASRPALLRERYENHAQTIVIDEIQKIPALLDEIHWLIENKGLSFLLTGSSSRKLRRGHANLLAGRARRKTMTPLCYPEIEEFNLESVMTSGLLPPHVLSSQPVEELRAYVADYLKEEIAGEAAVRNIPSFSEFLRVAAVSSSELINYTNIARESGINQRTVRSYFDILEDTYLGFRVSPWKKSKNRRMILAEKFYFFDVGVANFLMRRTPKIGSPEFGKSFEHYILMELKAYQAYRQPDLPIHYWRTSTGQEVDFLLGEGEVAVEVKGSPRIHEGDLHGLRALAADRPVRKSLLVCLEKELRSSAGIQILPLEHFLKQLWEGKII